MLQQGQRWRLTAAVTSNLRSAAGQPNPRNEGGDITRPRAYRRSRCEVLPRWRSSIVKNSVPGRRFRWRRVRVLRAIVLASVSYRNNPVTVDVLRISAAGEKPAGWTSP